MVLAEAPKPAASPQMESGPAHGLAAEIQKKIQSPSAAPKTLTHTEALPAVLSKRSSTAADCRGTRLLTFVLDRSKSSVNEQHLEWEKAAVAGSLPLVSADAYVSVIAFDAAPLVVVKETKADADGRSMILRRLQGLVPFGRTELQTGLDLAVELAGKSAAPCRVLLVLTDGKTFRAEEMNTVLRSLAEKNIFISTIALGVDGDEALLRSIAEAGGGSFARANSAAELKAQVADVLRKAKLSR